MCLEHFLSCASVLSNFDPWPHGNTDVRPQPNDGSVPPAVTWLVTSCDDYFVFHTSFYLSGLVKKKRQSRYCSHAWINRHRLSPMDFKLLWRVCVVVLWKGSTFNCVVLDSYNTCVLLCKEIPELLVISWRNIYIYSCFCLFGSYILFIKLCWYFKIL